MTSPVVVGQVAVEVLADAKRLAKSLRSEVEKAFKGLDLNKVIQDSVGGKALKVKVEAEFDGAALAAKVRKAVPARVPVGLDPDTKSIPDKVKGTRVPKVPVELDPVVALFQAEVKRQTAALARQVSVKVPIEADGGKLRAELGAQLGAVQAQAKIKVPVEPADKAAYEARLKALLAEVSARVKQNIKVDVDKRSAANLSGSIRDLPLGVLKKLQRGFLDAADAMSQSSSAAVRVGGSIVGSLGSAAGPIGLVGAALAVLTGGLAAVTAAATIAVPAIISVVGALAALPGILAGAGAGFGTLALGFRGIAEAFKPAAKSGGGGGSAEDAASRARRIAGAERGIEAARRGIASATRGLQAAERGYEDAQRGVADAQARLAKTQDAINRARREAKEDIEDLGRALRGAVLDEEDATLRVTEALRELNKAKESGILPDIQRADLEYRQAQLALEGAKDATEDLTQAAKESNTKGVEGSDQVQAALEDQRDAVQGVKDAQQGVVAAQNAILAANESLAASYDGLASAQDSLAEAQKKAASAGGGSAALKDVIKLAPEAQKFVNAIKALKPAFEELRLDVQNRLFSGLGDVVTRLAKSYQQPLKETLGSYADTFNVFFKDLGAAVGKPKFITDLQTGAESTRTAIEGIGKAVTTSLVPAFGALSAAAGPFIEKLGEEIAGIVTEFSNWVLEGEKTGGLTRFFDTAAEALHDIFTTGKEVGKIIGNLFRILINGNGKADKSAIDSLNDGLKAVNKYLGDPANQAKIAAFIDDIKQFFIDIKQAASKVSSVLDVLTGGGGDEGRATSLGEDIGKALVSGLIAGVGKAMQESVKTFLSYFLIPGVDTGSLIGALKQLLGIKSPSTVMAAIGRDLVAGLMKGISDKLSDLRRKASELPGKVRDGVGDAANSLYNTGRNMVAGLANGIVSLYGALKTRAAGLKTTVSNALSNAGTVLYSAGRNIVFGLYNGVVSLYGWLRDKVRAFINATVPDVIQQALGINSPSKVAAKLGTSVPEGLALGISSGQRDVEAAAAKLALAAVPDVGGVGLDVFASGQLEQSLTAAASSRVLLEFGPSISSDWLRNGLQRDIKFTSGGNVQQHLGTA